MTASALGLDPKLSVSEFLSLVLDTVVGVFEQAGVPLPERRYYTVGGVVADCPQLTIHLTQVYKGLPGDDPGMVQRCGSARTAVMVVQLFRNAPTGNGRQPPSTRIMMEHANDPAVDSWLLLDAAEAVDNAGWNTGVMAEVNVAEPQGGLIGMTMMLTAPIP